MSRYYKKKKEDIGLSPYELIFRGQQKTDKISIQAMDFDCENVREPEIHQLKELSTLKNTPNLSWINIDGLHDVKLIAQIGKMFDLPENVLSDIMNPSLRPKIEELEKGIFSTIKTLSYNEKKDELSVDNLSLIIMDTCLISFQEQSNSLFDPVRERIRKHKNKIRTSSPDYLAFAMLDIVVDNYIYIVGLLGDKIEEIENQLNDLNPDKKILDKINTYKGELNFLRKNIKPAREMIMNISKLDSEFLHDENHIHYKELQDNINEAVELADNYREILYDQINIYHTTVSAKLNDIMKVLTIFSVTFIPLTFIVGVYGTNFDYLPEIKWRYGYFIMWGIMILLSAGMLWYFKKKKWF